MFYFTNLSVKCLFQALSRHIVILSIGRFAVTQIAVLGGNIIIFSDKVEMEYRRFSDRYEVYVSIRK